ncbi:luciferase family domain protein [Mycobacterium xenopi 3993]|nr:luciferase family domain protein [Mycobacterium xenopi 3993]
MDFRVFVEPQQGASYTDQLVVAGPRKRSVTRGFSGPTTTWR